MSKIKENVEEINQFIKDLRFESPLKSPDSNRIFTQCYKYIHSLLLWENLLASSPSTKMSNSVILYFRELLSDVAASQALVLTGLYKPSRMMLRSSIENFLRIAALEQGFNVDNTKFTHELISLVKLSKIGDKHSPISSEIMTIIQLYSMLCAYTHASAPKFLAQKIPLKSMNVFENEQFTKIVDLTRNLTSRYNRVVFYLYHGLLGDAHHKHRDHILDALPKSLKARIYD